MKREGELVTGILLVLVLMAMAGNYDAGGGTHSWDDGPKRKRLSKEELRELAQRAGFSDPNVAAAVAMAESSGNPDARGDGGKSIGLWQIHMPSHPSYSLAQLLEPDGNANAAHAISSGGSNWGAWTTFRSGAYRAFL